MDYFGINSHSHDRNGRLLTLSLDEYRGYEAVEGQRLVVGLHPWDSEGIEIRSAEEVLSEAVADERVVAIGEVGIDPLRGVDVARQEELLRVQLAMAATVELPVMFHIVRRFDILMRLHREMRPKQAWGVHGFRGNVEVVKQLSRAGIYVSIGLKYNAVAVRELPEELLLLETDEAPEREIARVVAMVAETRGVSAEHLARVARENRTRFLGVEF